MRKSRDLSVGEKQTAASHRPALLVAGLAGREVSVDFTKRDNTARTITGRIESLSGEGDKEIVTIETVDGFRSANLSRIHRVEIH